MAFVGDPQIGYGDLLGDYERFTSLVDAINQTAPHLVVIPGDLVQERSPAETWLFRRALKSFDARVLLAPGNHDIVDKDSLEQYRARFGPDYFTREDSSVRWIVLNSETARSPLIDATEFDKQWTFIEATLGKPATVEKATVIVTHRPPFARSEDEPENGGSWPPKTRERLLSLCRQSGVSLILAGHLHETRQLRTRDGIEIRVLSGTARSFDRSPVGFEEIAIGKGSHRIEFRPVGPPAPPLPPSVPKLRDWTPRILDFGWGHFGFTVLFFLAALSCHRAARFRGGVRGARGPTGLWGVASIVALFHGINMQLDLDELLRESGRIFAKVVGVSQIRHLVTGTLLIGLIVLVTFGILSRRRAGASKREILAIVALLIPSLWFVLSTISHHSIGMLFEEFSWDVLMVISIGVVLLASQREILLMRRRRSPENLLSG